MIVLIKSTFKEDCGGGKREQKTCVSKRERSGH